MDNLDASYGNRANNSRSLSRAAGKAPGSGDRQSNSSLHLAIPQPSCSALDTGGRHAEGVRDPYSIPSPGPAARPTTITTGEIVRRAATGYLCACGTHPPDLSRSFTDLEDYEEDELAFDEAEFISDEEIAEEREHGT